MWNFFRRHSTKTSIADADKREIVAAFATMFRIIGGLDEALIDAAAQFRNLNHPFMARLVSQRHEFIWSTINNEFVVKALCIVFGATPEQTAAAFASPEALREIVERLANEQVEEPET